jgi:hypothetical protein
MFCGSGAGSIRGGGAGLPQCGDAKIKVSKYTTGKKNFVVNFTYFDANESAF